MLALAGVATAMACFLPDAGAGNVRPSVPSRGTIAFNCEQCSPLPISTIRWNGGRLVVRGDAGPEVRWSPSGPLFAYGYEGEIWLGTIDLTVERRLTHPSGNTPVSQVDGEPAWFPNGKRLVFVRRGALWTVGSDGRGAKLLYAQPASAKVFLGDPDVSHSGRRIAFDDSNGHLWVTGQRGLTVWRLGPANLNGSDPRWSPDDTRIAFLDGQFTLAVLDLRTDKVHDLGAGNPSIAPDGSVGDSYFAWSPNGRYLVGSTDSSYDCGDPNGPCQTMELWIVNAATGAAQLIYQTPDGGAIGGIDWR
jgi:Tol biopolymer transport system component